MDMKWIAVMVVGFIAAMVGMKKQKLGIGWGQPLAIVGAIIAVGGAVMNLSGFMGSKSKQMDAEMRYLRLQGQFLAEEVKNAANPSKVYVICDANYFLDENGNEKIRDYPLLNGVKAGLRGIEVVPVYKKIKVSAPKAAAPGQPAPMPAGVAELMNFNARDYKGIVDEIKKDKGGNIAVINIHRFPSEMRLPGALAMLKGYKVGFVVTSPIDEVKFAFADKGKSCAEVVAAVMTRNDADYDAAIPSGDKKAFEARFVLVPANGYEAAISKAIGKK